MITFLERYRSGEIADDDVEDMLDVEVGRWHRLTARPEGEDVHMWTYLGMTYEEFRRWVTDPNAIYSMKEQS